MYRSKESIRNWAGLLDYLRIETWVIDSRLRSEIERGFVHNMKIGGYSLKLLRVNLTSGAIQDETLSEDVIRRWLGGPGLASKILWDEVPAGIDPFSEKNKIVIMTGPLTGSPTVSTPRYTIASKSPLNGFYGASSASGVFGTRLKNAGYDGIIIEGESQTPVYLEISSRGPRLRSAEYLWGTFIKDTMRLLRETVSGEASIAVIGPAGENRVRFASVISDWRAHGRSGMGAVWGAKKLKAIIVGASDRALEPANPLALRDCTRRFAKVAEESGSRFYYGTYGTSGHVNTMNKLGILPTRNFQSGTFERADEISGERMKKDTVILSRSCGTTCQLKCEKISLVKEGPYAGSLSRGPEFETLDALGAQCGIDNLPVLIAAAQACDELGLDTISAGNAISFAMELSQRDLLPASLWEGPLQFGDGEALIRLIREIAFRQGLGDVLAEGVRLASQLLGEETVPYAIHVKGVELPAYDPRGAVGMGLAYATAFRGADHIRAFTIGKEILDPGADRYTPNGKALLVKSMQDLRSAFDAAGLCVFLGKDLDSEDTADLLNAVTGFDLSPDEVLLIGERIWNQERLLAVREGIGRDEDTLPRRFLEEPLPDGMTQGRVLELPILNQMLEEYYALRGWDPKTGYPTPDTLMRLGLATP
jgi:aldehyde:ferredoxin oxidoreductase